MPSAVDAAAVTDEVSLTAVPANTANPSVPSPIACPSVGNISAASTLNRNITDIERATSLARNMITQYGMSEKFGMAGLESIQNKYLDGRNVSNCSEETKTDIDKEVVRVLKECHEKAFNILKENRDALDEIAEFLINKETITGDQFMEIFNRVKSGRENSDSDAEESAAVNEENDKEE